MNLRLFSYTVFFLTIAHSALKAKSWVWQDNPGKHIDLFWGKKKIARYVYEKMDPKDRERTYKPFHHIFQTNGKEFLTKGPGGKFTHHRGIYFGFSKCSALNAEAKAVNVDTWHCKRAHQTHERVLEQLVNNDKASHSVEIGWRVDDGTIFATEHRTLSFSILPDESIQVDFQSKLSTEQKVVELDGDPQHAGFQFRAANEVAEKTNKETYYIRPNDGKAQNGKTKNWPNDKDMTNLLWKAQSIIVSDKRYTTLYLDHPSNPKPSFYSERDYGRFGSYFKSKITPQKPVLVKYRLIISQGEKTKKQCQDLSEKFLAGKTP
jgi:hypothetical protein